MAKQISQEGIGLSYDPNRHVLRMTLILQDGTPQDLYLQREHALKFYQFLGEVLAPYVDQNLT